MDRDAQIILGRRAAYLELGAFFDRLGVNCTSRMRSLLHARPDDLLRTGDYGDIYLSRNILDTMGAFCRRCAEGQPLADAARDTFEYFGQFGLPALDETAMKNLQAASRQAWMERAETLSDSDLRYMCLDECSRIMDILHLYLENNCIFQGGRIAFDLFDTAMDHGMGQPLPLAETVKAPVDGPERRMLDDMFRWLGQSALRSEFAIAQMDLRSIDQLMVLDQLSGFCQNLRESLVYAAANGGAEFYLWRAVPEIGDGLANDVPDTNLALRLLFADHVDGLFGLKVTEPLTGEELEALSQPHFLLALQALIKAVEARYPTSDIPPIELNEILMAGAARVETATRPPSPANAVFTPA